MSDYRLPPGACHWCGHPPHEERSCTHANITTKAPCTCARPRFVTHLITCTTGCTSASECTQPGEQPCPCHTQDQEET